MKITVSLQKLSIMRASLKDNLHVYNNMRGSMCQVALNEAITSHHGVKEDSCYEAVLVIMVHFKCQNIKSNIFARLLLMSKP